MAARETRSTEFVIERRARRGGFDRPPPHRGVLGVIGSIIWWFDGEFVILCRRFKRNVDQGDVW